MNSSILRKTVPGVLMFLAFCFEGNAQLRILEKNGLDEITAGNTYVVNDSDFPNSEAFLNAFKKNWKVTKGVQFIKTSEIKDKAAPGDSFFSLISTSETAGSSFGPGSSSGSTRIGLFLYLWTPTKSYFKKDRSPKTSDMNGLAQVELSGDPEMIMKIFGRSGRYNEVDTINISGNGHIINWNPGMIGIYLQELTTALQNKKKLDYGDDVTNKAALKLLQTNALFCDESEFNNLSSFSRKTSNIDKKDEIFEDYKFQYKIISNQELSDKLLNETEPFYFLLVTRVGSGKVILVINSKAGEVIYSRYHSMSYNLKSGDLKDLYKEVR